MACSDDVAIPKTAPLLLLPAELRNRIGFEVLAVGDFWKEYILTCDEDEIVIDRNEYLQPALLRTCKQIREEASKMYTGGELDGTSRPRSQARAAAQSLDMAHPPKTAVRRSGIPSEWQCVVKLVVVAQILP